MSWSAGLLAPFTQTFMLNAMLIAVLVAIPMALLSCFLVLKGWALMGDAIAHAVFPGVVLAYILGIPLAIGAFCAAMCCALATGFLNEHSRIKQDTLMGIVYAGMFGVGLVLYVNIQSNVHLAHILFGDILGVWPQDMRESAIIAVFTCSVIALKWKDLLLHTFDPAQARAIGLNTGLLHYGLLCLISLAVVGALKATGIILAIALLIAPGAIAFLLTQRFSVMLLLAVLLAVVIACAGVYLSFFINSAPAPTIVVLFTLVFIGAFGYTSRRAARQ